MWFALVPIAVALTLGVLVLPRRATPEFVPLPIPYARELARAAAADHDLAERARHDPLPGSVRALGSAIRAFHTLEARQADMSQLGMARRDVDAALIDALEAGDVALLQLRAAQL
jgi:hypothetical protein